jgi:hypothetical protein
VSLQLAAMRLDQPLERSLVGCSGKAHLPHFAKVSGYMANWDKPW